MSIFGNTGTFGSTNTQQPAQGGSSLMPSLFGNNQQQQQGQQTQPSIFGNTNTNTGTGGGLFGSNTNTNTPGNQPASGGLFGNTQTGNVFGGATNQQQQQPASGGGLFGSNTQQQQQQQQPASTGLFGNTQQPSSQQPASNPFGQQSAGTGSLFGNTQQQQPPGGGLFGNTNTQQQQQQQQPALGGGLFGNTQTGGGLFGNTQQQPTSAGGLFGNTQQQQQPQPAATGGLFGNTQQQQQQPIAGSSLFGSTNQQPTQSGGLWGSSTQPQQQTNATGGGLFSSTSTGTGLFGSKPGGLFGSTNTNVNGATASSDPLFGGQQQAQQQQQVGLFGNANNNNNNQQRTGLFGSTLGTSALGNSMLGGQQNNSNSLMASRMATSQQQQGDAQVQSQKIMRSIELIYQAWDPTSPQCRFQHNFYNIVDPHQVSLYGRPANARNDALWEKSVRENPDPTCLVPVIAIGFDDVRERVEAQAKQAQAQQEKLKDLKARLEALNTQHSVSNSSRLQRASAQQTQLTQRLLTFIQHLHLLIPSIRSSSIRPEEEQLRGKLEEIEDEVKKGRIKGKLNELWALLGAVSASRERVKGGASGDWAVVDEDGLAQIAHILSEQQSGLAHLTKILQKDLKDLRVIMGSGGGSSTEESHSNESENLWSSTNILKSSSLR